MKSTLRNAALFLSIAVLFPVAGCSQETGVVISTDAEGNTRINKVALDEELDATETTELDENEISGIIFMREEEKLARDVYDALYEKWGTAIFNNISASEQTHTDAVKSLIDKYELTDPAQDTEPGVFTSEVLQQLYDDLTTQGYLSEIEALRVGAAIEEIDILDIQKYVDQTENEDIITVYENLIKGSRNHLRSFVSAIEKRGYEYEPQYLSQDAYDDIISADMEINGG